MKRLIVVGLALCMSLSSHAGWFGPDTFDGCILDKMPSVANALAANLVLANCSPYARADAGTGRGLLAKFANGAECFRDKGKAVGDNLAATYIYAACHQLYDLPELDPAKVVPDDSPRK